MPQNKTPILGVHFDVVNYDTIVEAIFTAIRKRERAWLCTVNVAILMMRRDLPSLRDFIQRARWVVADGKPVVWISRFFGQGLPERITGVDLIERIAERAVEERTGIFFLGAEETIGQAMIMRFQERYPGLDIRGYRNGYFTPGEAPGIADSIAKSGAEILIVGMGVPRQEQFISDHWDKLGISFAIPVGGSFDVLSGHRKRAPELVQKIGMEWMYRLVQEPGRLWKRYLTTNLRFLYLTSIELFRKTF